MDQVEEKDLTETELREAGFECVCRNLTPPEAQTYMRLNPNYASAFDELNLGKWIVMKFNPASNAKSVVEETVKEETEGGGDDWYDD